MARVRLMSVIGAGQCDAGIAEMAERLGFELARRGWGVVCGGLGGVMEAACRGARRAGGLTVGILPGDDAGAANPYVDVIIPTGMGEARNALVVRAGEGAIAVAGEYGTLSEIALALKMGKPVVGLHTWSLMKDGVLDTGIIPAETPREAVEKALRAVEEKRR
ncbi:MAG: TIGR00725 family protein [Anaerolineae bacterium]